MAMHPAGLGWEFRCGVQALLIGVSTLFRVGTSFIL
jgi:hypothetical protein